MNLTTHTQRRVEENIVALTSLVSQNPDPELLKKYSGWGGLKDALYGTENFPILKQLLSAEEMQSIKSTVKSAYYTPSSLVSFIYDTLIKQGCCPKRILEPSAGHGIFIEQMPDSLRKGARVVAVEIDTMSARFLKTLYPDIDVHHQGFETFVTDEGFDLIIGNPPYGQVYVVDPSHADLAAFSIHHYFVGKSMRLLKNNGILAMVLPRYFMDASQKHVREVIASEGGSLLAAFRLPDDLFDDAKVTVDVVFLQKKTSHREWVESIKMEGNNRSYLNRYFVSHPQHILGTIHYIEVYGRTEITCKRRENFDVFAMLYQEASKLNTQQAELNGEEYKIRLQKRLQQIAETINNLRREYQQLKQLEEEICQTEFKLNQLYQQALPLL